MSHLSYYHPHRPRHISATACTKVMADGLSHPFNICISVPLTTYIPTSHSHNHWHPHILLSHLNNCLHPKEWPTSHLIHSTLALSNRFHLHPNVTSQWLSLTHTLSHFGDHLPNEQLNGPLVHSISRPSDCLHLHPSIDHPHPPCCFLVGVVHP